MKPNGAPRTITVCIESCKIDVLLNEHHHRQAAPSSSERRHYMPAGAGTISGGVARRSGPFGRRSSDPRSSKHRADCPKSTQRPTTIASLRTLDDNERTLLAEPAQLGYRELKVAADDAREVTDALDDLERHGAVHRSGEDFFWPSRACRRFDDLLGCGCTATEDDPA